MEAWWSLQIQESEPGGSSALFPEPLRTSGMSSLAPELSPGLQNGPSNWERVAPNKCLWWQPSPLMSSTDRLPCMEIHKSLDSLSIFQCICEPFQSIQKLVYLCCCVSVLLYRGSEGSHFLFRPFPPPFTNYVTYYDSPHPRAQVLTNGAPSFNSGTWAARRQGESPRSVREQQHPLPPGPKFQQSNLFLSTRERGEQGFKVCACSCARACDCACAFA